MAITREEIIRAAEAVEQSGEKPTMASVREHLGGGSFATISPVLREWRDGRTISKAIVLDMPGELKTVMERQASEFWQAASTLANEKLMTVQREAESAVSDAHAERDETLQEVTRLESSLETFGDKLMTAKKQTEEVQVVHNQLQTETIRLHEKLANSQNEVGRLRDDLNKANKDKERNADEASRLLGLTEQLKQELEAARQQADTQRQEVAQAKLEAGNLKNQLEQSREDQQRQQASLEQHQEEALTLKTTVATLEARLEDRTGKVAQLDAELATLRKDRHEEVQTIATLTAERESGKARIRELVQECGELRQENKSILLINAKMKTESKGNE
nr:DNA-binding protein [Endozoicomonas sp.]